MTIRPRTEEAATAEVDTGSPWPRLPNGTLLIVGFVIVLIAGWFFYRTTIPAPWLRDFGAEIALRAAPDPNAPLPQDSRQATPRGLANSPYICVARVIPIDWDRMVVLAGPGDDALLAGADWSAMDAKHTLDALTQQLASDRRYQAVIFMKDNKVIAAELFYTFWADLSALARPEGFSRADAVFTARVQNGTYVLSAPDAPADACS